MSNEIIQRDTVETICEKRDRAVELFSEAMEKIKEAKTILASVDKYAGPDSNAYQRLSYSTDGFVDDARKSIDRSFWNHLLKSSQLVTLMDAQAKEEFRKSMEKDVPELNVDDVIGTITTFIGNSENIFKRGVVNAFRELGFKYKTNDAFKIGPKIIMNSAVQFQTWGGWNFNYYMKADERLRDIERVFCVFDRKPPFPYDGGIAGVIRTAMQEKSQSGESEYFRFKMHKNGTLHIWFKNMKLVNKCNRIIAEHYGATLANAA